VLRVGCAFAVASETIRGGSGQGQSGGTVGEPKTIESGGQHDVTQPLAHTHQGTEDGDRPPLRKPRTESMPWRYGVYFSRNMAETNPLSVRCLIPRRSLSRRGIWAWHRGTLHRSWGGATIAGARQCGCAVRLEEVQWAHANCAWWLADGVESETGVQ
jgi:hypothetical protein